VEADGSSELNENTVADAKSSKAKKEAPPRASHSAASVENTGWCATAVGKARDKVIM
jgi:hypothetical protein